MKTAVLNIKIDPKVKNEAQKAAETPGHSSNYLKSRLGNYNNMNENYEGVIIEESLEDTSVLKGLDIVSTIVEPVTDEHKTPWVKQWTMHAVKIPANKADEIAEQISKVLDSAHNWYADFKSETDHFIIFRDKVFHVTDRFSKAQYDEAVRYGVTIGIPDYQLDFSSHIKQWER